MTDQPSPNADSALYARWLTSAETLVDTSRPSDMALAAYADYRLDPKDAEEVEAALVRDPALLAEILAVRRAKLTSVPSATFLARAKALVPGPASAGILPFQRKPAIPRNVGSGLRRVAAWGAVAASIVFVSMIGFDLGMEVQHAIERVPSGTPVDLLDQVEPQIG